MTLQQLTPPVHKGSIYGNSLANICIKLKFLFFHHIALAQSAAILDKSIMFNVTGWGTLRKKGQSSQRLRRVNLPFVPDEECKNVYNILRLTKVKVREGMICAGNILKVYNFL